MNYKQQSAKSSRDLFREIDALCDEVDSAMPNVEEAVETSPMHRVLEDQEDRVFTWFILCRELEIKKESHQCDF